MDPPAASERKPNGERPNTKVVYSLGENQYAYGPKSASACAFTSGMFAAFLLGSPTRKPRNTPERLTNWMHLGCYLYERDFEGIAKRQSANPNDKRNRHTDVVTAVGAVPALSMYLSLEGEYPCILRDKGPEDAQDTLFAQQLALITLEQALCRLALLSLSGPIAATLIMASAKSVNTIGIRCKPSVDVVREHLKAALDPEGDASRYESTQLDDFDQAAAHFYIDFIDSHSNSPLTGLSAPNGIAVWITFPTLASLRDYILKRYRDVTGSEAHRAKDKLSSPRNCFDIQAWRAKMAEPPFDEFTKLLTDEGFKRWLTEKTKSGAVGKKRKDY